ncbi:MAG: hypothetical protein ACE5DX_02595 [Candidatus Dojkabacteria bacterium]
MRDNKWLQDKMYELWENYFVDTPRKNRVLIKFGRASKRQLGSIRWVTEKTRGMKDLLNGENDLQAGRQEFDDERTSLIIITNHFKDTSIPYEVVTATIAHEMCHYTHGFNSPLQQLYDHPHKGGVIRREMERRGLGGLYRTANKWLKEYWAKYLHSKH